MEADQADSPGDSCPDPELSRFIDNMGLHFERNCRTGRVVRLQAALTPVQIAETHRVPRKRASASLILPVAARPAGSANMPFQAAAASILRVSMHRRVTLQPFIYEPVRETAASPRLCLLMNSRVRITV